MCKSNESSTRWLWGSLFFAALAVSACGDSSSSGGGGGNSGSGGSATGGAGGSIGGAAGAGNASGHCGALPFVRSCSYPVGSQDCQDFYGAWGDANATCGWESAVSDAACEVPKPVTACVRRTCELRWQLADAGVDGGVDAGGDAGPIDPHPWDCSASSTCEGYKLLGSCDSAAEGRCVDHYAIVTDAAQARAALESACTYANGTFSTAACPSAVTTPSCRREQCSVMHDLFVEDAGFPTPCDGVSFAP